MHAGECCHAARRMVMPSVIRSKCHDFGFTAGAVRQVQNVAMRELKLKEAALACLSQWFVKSCLQSLQSPLSLTGSNRALDVQSL